MKFSNTVLSLITGFTFMNLGHVTPAQALLQGGETGGGGDSYVLDFVKVANQEIYPWLNTIGAASLNPGIDANEFLISVNPKDILSVDHVFETCDGSSRGREVEACFNSATGKTYLSRTRYPLLVSSPIKIGIVAHEVFRKMGIEGDDYEVSKQMPIAKIGNAKDFDDRWQLKQLPKYTNIILRSEIRIPAKTDRVNINTGAADTNPFLTRDGVQCHLRASAQRLSDTVLTVPGGLVLKLNYVSEIDYSGLKSQRMKFLNRDELEIECESLIAMPTVADLRTFVDVVAPTDQDQLQNCARTVQDMQYGDEKVSFTAALAICRKYSERDIRCADEMRGSTYSSTRMSISDATEFCHTVTDSELDCANQYVGHNDDNGKRMDLPDAVIFCRKMFN